MPDDRPAAAKLRSEGFASVLFPWSRIWREAVLALIAAVVSTAVGVFALKITPTTLGQRWTAGGDDQVLHYVIFTSGTRVFPYFANPGLGFPHAQNLFFAPLFDVWSAIYARTAGLLGASGVVALNLYNVLAFGAIAVTAYGFFRALRARRTTSVVLAVIVSVMPYHFIQLTEGHPLIANYWAVPLIGILALMIVGGKADPVSAWAEAAPSRAVLLTRRLVPLVLLTVAVAWTQSYFYVFALVLLGLLWGTVSLHRLVTTRSVRDLLWPTITLGSLISFVGVQLAWLSINFGDRTSDYFTTRIPEESELYAGKVVSLLMPATFSGVGPLARFALLYARGSSIAPTAEPSGSAIVAVIGMVLLMLTLVVRATGSPARNPAGRLGRLVYDSRVGALAVVFFWGLLFYVTGGLNVVFAYLVSPEIRAWSRLAIVLGTLGLGFLALVIDRITRRRWLRYGSLAIACAIALVDQVAGAHAGVSLIPEPDTVIRNYAAAASAALKPGCGIVELPLKGFPETGRIGAMGDYDEGLPYVLQPRGSTLRFSYGAVRGTDDALPWSKVTDAASFASATKASGACAVQVDTKAFAGHEDQWKSLVSSVGDASHPLVTSSDGRYLLFAVGT